MRAKSPGHKKGRLSALLFCRNNSTQRCASQDYPTVEGEPPCPIDVLRRDLMSAQHLAIEPGVVELHNF